MTTDFNSSDGKCVADSLGLGRLSDGESGMDPELLQRLYRYARNENGERVLFKTHQKFVRGWVDLDAPAARAIVSVFVALDDTETLKKAHRITQTNLEAQAWNDLLGIESPPIICKVLIHGLRWGLRFQSTEPAMRGHEIINEQLPPIPNAASSPQDNDPPPEASRSAAGARDRASGQRPTAEDTLRQAGLPT